MKKKLLAVVMILSLVLSVFTACGSKTEKNSATQATTEATTSETTAAEATTVTAEAEEQTISICWWGNQTRNDRTVAAIELYESLNPNITVEYEFSDWSSYWDKLSTQAAGGNLPDIIQHDYAYIAQYVGSNQLADLTPFVESGLLDVSKVADSILAGGTINEKLYALCLGTNAPNMSYDKAIVEEAGVTVPMQPTIEELYEIGKVIYEKTGVKTIFDGGLAMLTMISRSQGDNVFGDILEGKTDYISKHFDYVQKFAEAEWAITPDILAEKNPDVVETKPIIDQTTWNDFATSNMFISISNAAGRELEMTMYPQSEDQVKENMYLKPSMFFTIAETSEHKEAAAQFLNWFTNDVDCNKILLGERGIPVASNIAEVIKDEVDDITVKVYDYISEVAKVATPIDAPSPSGSGEVDAYIKTVVEGIRFGAMDSKTATEDFAAQAKKVLEEAGK